MTKTGKLFGDGIAMLLVRRRLTTMAIERILSLTLDFPGSTMIQKQELTIIGIGNMIRKSVAIYDLIHWG